MTSHLARPIALCCATIAFALAGTSGAQAPAAPPAAPPAAKHCADCGVVRSIQQVEEEGKSSGLGAVAGGVLGGVLGHQIGSGRGNTVATIAGAGVGAYAGNKVEKNRNAKSYWQVSIRMDDGKTRSFHYASRPDVNEGERVKLIDGGKRLALIAN
ncbi:MAG: glycine zipper 2TM domain-containing protein [Candidatus Levyibacteriota bacterium]